MAMRRIALNLAERTLGRGCQEVIEIHWRGAMPISHADRAPQGAGMPRRLQLGKRISPTVLGVVVAAALVVGLVVTGRLLRVPTADTPVQSAATIVAAPYRIGERLACPLAHPVVAVAGGRSYPPGHPTPTPPDARVVGCYDSTGQASAAGYPPAPLPPGALDLDGQYLIPTPRQLHHQCRQAANRVGFAVPCPKLLPAVAPNTEPPAPCDLSSMPSCTPRSGYLLQAGGFTVPSDRIIAYQNYGARLVIAAAKRLSATAVSCTEERPIATTRVRARVGALFWCPPDAWPHGGSVLLRWRERGTILVVSVTGNSGLHQRLVVALAEHLNLVRPDK
jgi:hypothetical protein